MADTTTLDEIRAWCAAEEADLARTRPCHVCGLAGVGYAYRVAGMYDSAGVPVRAHEECAR